MPADRVRSNSKSLQWSPQQVAALKAVNAWFSESEAPTFYLAGYAGTGKTTLVQEIARRVDGGVAFAAFTGKAAAVMRAKGCTDADTIDSLIYHPKLQHKCASRPPCAQPAECSSGDPCRFRRERFVGRALNSNSAAKSAALVIIDEVSMVDEKMALDLLSFGTPVLVLGDPAQLPPVFGAGYFTKGKPDMMLTEVHRQALGSPIIKLATRVREGKGLRRGHYDESAVIGGCSVGDMLDHDQIIVGTHRERRRINRQCRQHLGFERKEPPQPGEKLVCLKNRRRRGLRNGTMWTVVEAGRELHGFVGMIVESDAGDQVEVNAPLEGFDALDGNGTDLPGDPFAFGYAITCHKAQGSQWNSVCVIDESQTFQAHRFNWLYTAITRAAKRVTVIG